VNVNLILVGIGTVAGAFGVVAAFYLNNRTENRIAAADAAKAQREEAEGKAVNWKSLTEQIAKERDRTASEAQKQADQYERQLEHLRKQHSDEIRALKTQWERDIERLSAAHDQERTELKLRYDGEIADLRVQLERCQDKARELYGEIYELQKRLPPAQAQ
jgi:hypothetical protein